REGPGQEIAGSGRTLRWSELLGMESQVFHQVATLLTSATGVDLGACGSPENPRHQLFDALKASLPGLTASVERNAEGLRCISVGWMQESPFEDARLGGGEEDTRGHRIKEMRERVHSRGLNIRPGKVKEIRSACLFPTREIAAGKAVHELEAAAFHVGSLC